MSGVAFTKNISMTLDEASIDRAIQEILQFKEDLRYAMQGLVEELADSGATIAKVQVTELHAVDTGALMASIGYGAFDPASRTAIIYAGSYYACYVEFGTGIVGEENPHPGGTTDDFVVMGENGSLYSKYDTNGHGERGWWYRPVGSKSYRWTKGMPARPFMYNTYIQLSEIAERYGGKTIAEYIP